MDEDFYRIEKKNNIAVMVLTLDSFTHEDNEELKKPFDQLLNEGNQKIILDMGQTKYISSLILASLVFMHKRAKDAGGNLILCNVKDRVKEIMTVTNLDKVFDITDTMEEAIQKFNKKF